MSEAINRFMGGEQPKRHISETQDTCSHCGQLICTTSLVTQRVDGGGVERFVILDGRYRVKRNDEGLPLGPPEPMCACRPDQGTGFGAVEFLEGRYRIDCDADGRPVSEPEPTVQEL